MRENMQSVAKEYTKRNHWRKIWRRIAGGLACVVVFCTIYALMLPALTLESETICGLEEHTHTEECYRQITSEQVSVLNCKLEAHSHGEECYDAEGKLLCGQVNYVLHTHTEVCSVDGELVCQLPEVKAHSHGDGCWETRKAAPVLVCENAEEDHVHGDECYAVPLSCDIPVSEEHNHEDACYQTETVLVCTVPEIKAHSHSAECEGGCDMIEVAAHVHGEDCFETQEISVDTEELTCQIPEREEHTHGPMCYGTWVLECQLEEHTHTENCEPKQELTEEELAQVDAVIQQIDTLETTEQVEAKLAEYETAEDWEGYETYREEAAQKIQAVRDSYNVLSDAQKQKVTNAAKLTQLDWLVPAATLEEEENGNTGKIEPWLNDDWAYIYDFKVNAYTTGTSPWDANDYPGNDTDAGNNVLRTFDVMTYTLSFKTNLYDEIMQGNVGGIGSGRVYFEFILPLSAEQARFEKDGTFLTAANDIKYNELIDVEIDGVTCQVLRGSFTLVSTEGNAAAIPGYNELIVSIRALRMKNGDTIEPTFTMWLQHNDVGVDYDKTNDRVPVSMVPETKQENGENVPYVCAEHGKCEAVKCEDVPEVTISARPMFNVAVVGIHPMNSTVGTYDFNSGFEKAINDGLGTVEGRLNGMGLRLEIRGKESQKVGTNEIESHGLRGAEIPLSGTITFDVQMSTFFDPIGDGVYRQKQEEPDYLAQFWTGGGNYLDSEAAKSTEDEIKKTANQTGRKVNAGSDRNAYLPVNWALPDPYDYRSCYNGGQWTFAEVKEVKDGVEYVVPGKLRVTVSGFKINTAHFPSTFTSGNKGDGSYGYYDTNAIKDFWEIEQAVFSGGELWVLQPYYGLYGKNKGKYICDKTDDEDKPYNDGQFYTQISVSNLQITADDKPVDPEHIKLSERTNDDSKEWGKYLKQEGDLDGRILYVKHGTSTYNDVLTDGGYEQDCDWVAAGSGVTIESMLVQDNAEAEYIAVAFDDLIKFDDEFFKPDGNYRLVTEGNKPVITTVYWAVWKGKDDYPMGSGWPNDQYMMEATMDDMAYYSSLKDIPQNYAVVGLLREVRGVSGNSGMNHYAIYVDGTVKGQGGNVYMTTRNSYAWSQQDVEAEVRKFWGVSNDTILTDEHYNKYVQAETGGFPSRKNNDKTLFLPGTLTTFDPASGYPQPSWWHDFSHTQTKEDGSYISAFSEVKKATYKDGVYESGVGALHYQDSCLVIPYTTKIIKTTAQTVDNGSWKQSYDMSQNQRTVVYRLNASIERTSGEGGSDSDTINTTVYIEDTLPVGLLYGGSSYLGGEYTQDSSCQGPGSFTGTVIEPEFIQGGGDEPTTVRWKLNVEANLNGTTSLEPIYFYCTINGDDKNNESTRELKNMVKIWSTIDNDDDTDDDNVRPFESRYKNVDSYSIQVLNTNAASLSKISDFLVVEKGDDFGFTMDVGNNSGKEQKDTVIVEALPINGLEKEGMQASKFNGRLVVSQFAAVLVNANSEEPLGDFKFYYTTSEDFEGLLGSDILNMIKSSGQTVENWIWAQGDAWRPLEMGSKTMTKDEITYKVMSLPTVDDQVRWEDKTQQITAIVAVGNLPAGATMKMHITIQLPDGQPLDRMVNYLSQDTLTSYASAQMVNRTLQGLTWLDADRDGCRDERENMIYGVKVSLLNQNGDPVYYTNDPHKPVVIQTGQTTSVLTGEMKNLLGENGELLVEHKDWNYQFTDLPAGNYILQFTHGTENPDISSMVASPVNNVSNDSLDSDAEATYTGSTGSKVLEHTRIEDIVMKPTTQLIDGNQKSEHNDSGFYYRDVELPSTGGMGTILFYVIGGPLTLAAGAALCRKKCKEKGSSES